MKFFTILSMFAVVFVIVCGASTTRAEDGVSIREEKRKEIPVDRLIKNLENPRREKTMQPERVLDILNVKEGDAVADVGAGTGFFTFRLASRVGDKGLVYAVEVEDRLLALINSKMAENKVSNIILVKATETDANLPPASCDKILSVGSYYYYKDPVSVMRNLRKALKPGGIVGLIDLDRAKRPHLANPNAVVKPDAIKPRFKEDVIEEMRQAGFILRESHDFLDYRFYMIFDPVPENN